MIAIDPARHLTFREAAEYTGYSERTLHRKPLQRIRVSGDPDSGHKVYVLKHELDALIASMKKAKAI